MRIICKWYLRNKKEYAEASACSRIAENTNIITDLQTTGLLEEILRNDNLNTAYKKVKSNKGSGGVDGMGVEELLTYLRKHGRELNQQILGGKYKPNPVRRVEVPKEEKGKDRIPNGTYGGVRGRGIIQIPLLLDYKRRK